jgi:hypothetical protein
VGGADDSNRGSVREKARLKPTVSEPSSGYAYHDESRVDSMRGPSARPSTPRVGSAPSPANDTGQPRHSVAKATMVGGFALPPMHESGALPTRDPSAPSPARSSLPSEARRPLSEPPEVGSWPPMPSVPPELAGTADASSVSATTADEALETMPTDPPRAAAGGAIWDSMPSVMHSQQPEAAAPAGESEPESSGFEAASTGSRKGLPQAEPRISALLRDTESEVEAEPANQPIGTQSMRARMSRLEAGYGDVRFAKLDPMVERSAWEQVAKELEGKQLPPQLTLLQVMARRELVDDKSAVALTREAIKAIALLLEVPETSPTALLLAKRLLRRNRAAPQGQPTKGLSFGVVLAGLTVGIGVGWLVTKIFL